MEGVFELDDDGGGREGGLLLEALTLFRRATMI